MSQLTPEGKDFSEYDERTKSITRNVIGALFAILILFNLGLGIGIPWGIHLLAVYLGWPVALDVVLIILSGVLVGFPRILKAVNLLITGPKIMSEVGL